MNLATRNRAVIVSGVAALLAALGLLDDRLLGVKGILANLGFEFSDKTNNAFYGLVISLVVALGVYWVLFFKRKGASVIAVVLFPSIAAFPYFLLLSRLVESLTSQLSLTVTVFVVTLFYWLVMYLLILTANVLNGTVFYDIPLGQAGKAAQFIFSLISVYLFQTYLVSVGYASWLVLILLLGYITYLTFSNVWVLQMTMRQTMLTTVLIAVIMLLILGVLTVWPIEVVYFTLVTVISFYILLNVAIEIRSYVGRMVWLEYLMLILLCFFLLAANSAWGIQGSLL